MCLSITVRLVIMPALYISAVSLLTVAACDAIGAQGSSVLDPSFMYKAHCVHSCFQWDMTRWHLSLQK